MTPELEPNRRAIVILYRRFLAADRAWQVARIEAMSWFPTSIPSSVVQIGEPGSRIRRLYDRRDQAIAKLNVARTRRQESRARALRRIRVLALPKS